jgi:hypothetical protein
MPAVRSKWLPARIIGHVRLALIGRLLTPGELRLKSAEPIDCHREAVVRDPVLGSMWTQRVWVLCAYLVSKGDLAWVDQAPLQISCMVGPVGIGPVAQYLSPYSRGVSNDTDTNRLRCNNRVSNAQR